MDGWVKGRRLETRRQRHKQQHKDSFVFFIPFLPLKEIFALATNYIWGGEVKNKNKKLKDGKIVLRAEQS